MVGYAPQAVREACCVKETYSYKEDTFAECLKKDGLITIILLGKSNQIG